MLIFACISPHPPIILPSVGSESDRAQVKNTIKALEKLGKKLKAINPDKILISSPHPDWGFNVPLFFLAKDFKGEMKTFLTGLESPQLWFSKGKETYTRYKIQDTRYTFAVIASGDLSHCLKEDGPYGFHPDGPKFDKTLIDYLKKKDIEAILKLDDYFPQAGECGLRSFCFLLGILEAHSASSGQAHPASLGQAWQSEILSYEAPFGVGYLVANFKLTP